MKPGPVIDLFVCSCHDENWVRVLVTVGGKTTVYFMRRGTAASAISDLAAALA